MNRNLDRTTNCDAIVDLIPDYAFGLTDPAETARVEAGLSDCQEAIAQLVDFQNIQNAMRADVPQIEPSPQLESRLIAALQNPAKQTPLKPIRRLPVRRGWLATAGAVAALLLTNIYWFGRVNDLSARANTPTPQIIGSQPPNAFVLANTSELRWVRLPPSQQNTGAAAFLMWNAESKIGILYATGFPTVAAGMTYHLWLTRATEFLSGGDLTVDPNGKGALLFNIQEPIDKWTWARITVEPIDGSKKPSEMVIVNGKL